MGVSADTVNGLLEQFHGRGRGVIAKYGLKDHEGTSMLNSIQAHINEHDKTVMDDFTSADTSEGMIEATGERYLSLIENEAKRIQGQESNKLAALGAAMNRTTPSDSPAWNQLVSHAASEVDRIGKIYGETIIGMPKTMKDKLDSDLAKALTQIDVSYRNDPSPLNAEKTSKQLTNTLNVIEKHLDEVAKASMKNEVNSIISQKMTELQEKEMTLLSLDKSMTREQSLGWRRVIKEASTQVNNLSKSNYLVYSTNDRKTKLNAINAKIGLLDKIISNADAVSSSLSGYFGNTGSRFHAKQASTIDLGHVAHPNPPKSFNKGKPPGFKGFSGNMTAEQLRQVHSDNANPAHIRAMEYFMSQGLSFNEAHEAAKSHGYKVKGGVLSMDLDIRSSHLGGGADPFF